VRRRERRVRRLPRDSLIEGREITEAHRNRAGSRRLAGQVRGIVAVPLISEFEVRFLCASAEAGRAMRASSWSLFGASVRGAGASVSVASFRHSAGPECRVAQPVGVAARHVGGAS
jgi:hypothetical protein